MDDLIDLIATDQKASEVTDKIKNTLKERFPNLNYISLFEKILNRNILLL